MPGLWNSYGSVDPVVVVVDPLPKLSLNRVSTKLAMVYAASKIRSPITAF